jgi:hypothetical protein
MDSKTSMVGFDRFIRGPDVRLVWKGNQQFGKCTMVSIDSHDVVTGLDVRETSREVHAS